MYNCQCIPPCFPTTSRDSSVTEPAVRPRVSSGIPSRRWTAGSWQLKSSRGCCNSGVSITLRGIWGLLGDLKSSGESLFFRQPCQRIPDNLETHKLKRDPVRSRNVPSKAEDVRDIFPAPRFRIFSRNFLREKFDGFLDFPSHPKPDTPHNVSGFS